MCPAKAAEHNTCPGAATYRVSARLACQRRAGRLEQECRCSCLAQTEEEREGEEAAAGSAMLWVMRGLGGCSGLD